jgi:hypothetical protein
MGWFMKNGCKTRRCRVWCGYALAGASEVMVAAAIAANARKVEPILMGVSCLLS